MSDIWNKLKAPLAPEKVSWRIGSTAADKKKGMALAYIDARDVMERLDEVCGPEGWRDAYCETARGRIICTIGIKIGDEWVSKSDGAGDTDVEGDKGALSDAFKRAAVKWGIGRYLYDIDSPWVELEAAGKSFKIAASAKPALIRALNGAASTPPQEQEPAHVTDGKKIKALIEGINDTDELLAFWESEDLLERRKAIHAAHKPTADRLTQIYQQRLAALSPEGKKVA